ncbi:hypothetical protein [Micromonospora matsumotoense]|uniref:hypothetical protein n=1 Tax=Micromonospora matsumotoense TaxID=121616 RepID=UPI00114CBDB9
MVRVRGATEHEIFPDCSGCALDAVNAYLTTGILPTRNITCAPGAFHFRTGPDGVSGRRGVPD